MDFYQRRATVERLLQKDVLLFALRGVTTAAEFVDEAFAAFESSSEETDMGSTLQNILRELSQFPAVDLSDLVVEHADALWVVEVKSQTNTLNARSLPQTLRSLKSRAGEYGRMSRTPRKLVKPMIGVLRGSSRDQSRTYPSTDLANRDIWAFDYRYIVGQAFWIWLTGRPNITALVGDFSTGGAALKAARDACRVNLKSQLEARLAAARLNTDIQSIFKLGEAK